MKSYKITVNGKSYNVDVEETGSTSTPVNRPVVQSAAPAPAPVAAAPKAPVAAQGDVVAPMPGKVLDVKVKVGDSVKSGDVLLILEAMKMENEIYAPGNGKITAIHADKGQNVSSGAPLVSIG